MVDYVYPKLNQGNWETCSHTHLQSGKKDIVIGYMDLARLKVSIVGDFEPY